MRSIPPEEVAAKLFLLLAPIAGLVSVVTLAWLIWEWGEPALWPHRWAILDV